MSEGVEMAERAPGTRRNAGLFLMACGVVFLLFSMALTLSEVTTFIAQVRIVVLIAGLTALAAGAILYGLARSKIS